MGRWSEDRVESFRRRHRLGERLPGRLLRWAGPGMAWVEVDGQELLARLDAGPEPGAELLFQVRRLVPDIVLQELGASGGGEETPAQWVQRWRAAWDRIEAQRPDGSGLERLGSATGENGGLESWTQLFAAQERLNALLAGSGGVRVACAPWLCPGARRVEVLVPAGGAALDQGMLEALCDAEFDALGRVLVRLFVRVPAVRFRLVMERPDRGPLVAERMMERLRALPGMDPELLGVERLPAGLPRGVLGAFLGSAGRYPFLRVNRRV